KMQWGYRTVCYAESDDGLRWRRPALGRYEFRGSADNNICFAHHDFLKTPQKGVSSVVMLDETQIPEADRRGYKYLMTYTLRGGGPAEEDKDQVFLIGSHDGVDWDRDGQTSLGLVGIGDGWMGLTYDEQMEKYV